MEKETLYKFFDGKASREEKEAVRIWLESSPENEQMLFREREFFDAMILSGSTKSAGTEKNLYSVSFSIFSVSVYKANKQEISLTEKGFFLRKSFNQTPCTWNLPVIFAYLSPDIENFSRQSDFCRQPSADLPTIIDRQVSAKEFWQESQ